MIIQLKDGTTIEVTFTEEGFGPAYNVATALDESIFSEDNLSSVTIDRVDKGRMALDFFRPDGLQFYLRELSKEEQQIYQVQDKIDEVVSEPIFTSLSATMTDITVPANGRTNVQIPIFNIPEGFFFGAYREVSLAGSDSGFENCAIQFFGSSSNGTKANIGIKNFLNSAVTVSVNVTVLFMKDFSQSIVGAGEAMIEEEEE